MKNYVMNFSQFVNEDKTNEFFSFKKKEPHPLKKEYNKFIDIIDKLPMKYDWFYEEFSEKAKVVTSIDELISVVTDTIDNLNQLGGEASSSNSEAEVTEELVQFKEELKPLASVVYAT